MTQGGLKKLKGEREERYDRDWEGQMQSEDGKRELPRQTEREQESQGGSEG